MEGARWDTQQGIIMESRLKELHPMMPVINIRVIQEEKNRIRVLTLFFISGDHAGQAGSEKHVRVSGVQD